MGSPLTLPSMATLSFPLSLVHRGFGSYRAEVRGKTVQYYARKLFKELNTNFRGSCNGIWSFSTENHPWCPNDVGQNWKYLPTNRNSATWTDAGTGLDIMPIQDTSKGTLLLEKRGQPFSDNFPSYFLLFQHGINNSKFRQCPSGPRGYWWRDSTTHRSVEN